jgi:hypothetical protein
LGRAAFFSAGRTADGKPIEFALIAVELAKYFGVDPDVMMSKPFSRLLLLQHRVYTVEAKRAEYVEQQRRDAERS